MDWKIIILFLIVTFNSYSQKMEDYTIFKDGEVYINFRKYTQEIMPQIVAELEKYNYKKPTEEHYKKVIHSFINKELLPQNIVVLNDNLCPYIAIQDKGIIYTDGDDAEIDDTPYGPPNCLCLFRKENSIAPTCETMHFPLG